MEQWVVIFLLFSLGDNVEDAVLCLFFNSELVIENPHNRFLIHQKSSKRVVENAVYFINLNVRNI